MDSLVLRHPIICTEFNVRSFNSVDCSRTVMYRRELHPPPPPTIIQSLDKGLGSLQDWLTSLASLSGPIRFALSTVHTVQCTHCLTYKLHH